jgi:hypothetical protein
MAARYVVKNGWIGKADWPSWELSFLALDLRGGLAFWGGRWLCRVRNSRTAGETRKMLRRRGAEEYAVVANSMAKTLRMKSVAIAAGPYGVKNDSLDWRADQRMTAV